MDETNEDVTLDTTNEDEVTTEDTEVVDEEKETLRQQNKELFARAKKAEGFVLENGEWVKKPEKKSEKEKKETKSDDGLSQKDLYALMNAHVPEDDIDQVADYAKLKGITVSEALKTSFVKSLLSDSEEMRKSAEVTTVGTRRAPTGKISDEAFLKKIETDGVPEAGTPEAERLFEIRHRKN